MNVFICLVGVILMIVVSAILSAKERCEETQEMLIDQMIDVLNGTCSPPTHLHSCCACPECNKLSHIAASVAEWKQMRRQRRHE